MFSHHHHHTQTRPINNVQPDYNSSTKEKQKNKFYNHQPPTTTKGGKKTRRPNEKQRNTKKVRKTNLTKELVFTSLCVGGGGKKQRSRYCNRIEEKRQMVNQNSEPNNVSSVLVTFILDALLGNSTINAVGYTQL